jgi:hypothetical protein
VGIALAIVFAIPVGAQLQEDRDRDALEKIRREGIDRSRVMEISSYLTDVHGPRLTNSPNIKAAAQWATKTMTEWGLKDVKLETWGPFGRGWSNERFYAALIKPYHYTLIGHSKPWTPGTSGTLTGDVVYAPLATQADLAKFRGKLRGKFVMVMAPRELKALFDPVATRFTDRELEALANPRGAARGGAPGAPPQGGGNRGGGGQPAPQPLTVSQRNQFLLEEGVLAMIDHGSASGGNAVVQSGGDYLPNAPQVPVQIVISTEQYGLMLRDLEKNVPVTMELNVENKFYSDDLNSFNILGDIPGSTKPDEIVMIGAHFDSWTAGTGATDNAAGSAVMMEAMRILKTTGVPMARTVRIGLWTGEEQGLLGSQAYVREHFADRRDMRLKPEHDKFSVYFNVDNGTGQIRGVFMQGNEGARPLFEEWMRPFRSFGMTTLTASSTGGTDHTSFERVGLPGFQFIQDPIEYDTRTHHTSMDLYERLQPKDMMQNAVIVASFVYDAANHPERFPRKPLPAAQPDRTPGPRGGGQ